MKFTTDKSLDILLSRADDLEELANKYNKPQVMGFLNSTEQAYIVSHLGKKNKNFSFWGGYDNAERKFIGFFPYEEDKSFYGIEAVKFIYNKKYNLSHRDFLGALMGLNLKRESIGDIVVYEGEAVAFVTAVAKSVILNEVDKIGSVGVKTESISAEDIDYEPTFTDITGSVASLRIDCITAFITGKSRSDAEKMIISGQVFVNSLPFTKSNKDIAEGDLITVRGWGKYIFDSITGESKKGKLKILLKKYV